MTKRLILLLTVLLLVIIGLLPVLAMFSKSIMQDGRLTFSFYQTLFTSHEWILIRNSFVLSLLTSFFTSVIGIPLGFLLVKTDLPCRQLFTIIFSIPLLIPSYIMAVSWFDLLSSSRVISNSAAHLLTQWLFGLPGCVFVLSSVYLPIIMLLTMTSFKVVNARLEEAGRLVTKWPRVLTQITLPIMLPGVLFAIVLVFLLSLGEFSVPNYLRYPVFPVESFTQFSAFYDYGAATAAAVPLALIALIVLFAERMILRESNYQFRSTENKTFLKIPLGKTRKWLFLSVSLLCFIDVIIPLLVLIYKSLSLTAYIDAFTRTAGSMLRSILFAMSGATFLTVFGFLLGYIIQTRTFSFWRSVDYLTIFLFTLPSTVVGIGLISLWNSPFSNFIYATPLIIIIGYIAQFSALGSRIMIANLAQIPKSMEEAAQVVGAGWLRRTTRITAPLAKRGLITAWLVSYVFCLRDTGITMMVYPPGQDTLPVRIYTLMANGTPEVIAALCVMMIAITLLPLGVLGIVFRTRRGN